MTAILPTIGRKIYFYPNGSDPAVQQFDAQPIDATVVYVWPKAHPNDLDTMNLSIIDHAGATHFKPHVALIQDGTPLPIAGAYAQWMPYQVGQAAKKESDSAVSSAAGAATTAATSDSSASSESPSTAAPIPTISPSDPIPTPSPSTVQLPASAVASTAASTDASNSAPAPVAAPVQQSPTTDPAPSASPASPAVVVFPPVEVQSPPVIVGSGSATPPTASASNTPTAVAPSAAPTTDVPQSVTLDRITSKIKSAVYVFGKDAFPNDPAFSTLTFCGMVLQNGFTIIGKSACVDPKKFNEEDGKTYAYKDAFEQIWQLEGYLLKQEIYQAAQPSIAQ